MAAGPAAAAPMISRSAAEVCLIDAPRTLHVGRCDHIHLSPGKVKLLSGIAEPIDKCQRRLEIVKQVALTQAVAEDFPAGGRAHDTSTHTSPSRTSTG